ncbi:hypothetical protein HK102_009284 [Quaeritorhiza haematococci]|nr:hypothetical protein HK102_009284 [Quaeritorhiza haematococci]
MPVSASFHMERQQSTGSPTPSLHSSGSGSSFNFSNSQSFHNSRFSSLPRCGSSASSETPTERPRAQSSTAADIQRDGTRSFSITTRPALGFTRDGPSSFQALHIVITASAAKRLCEKKMFRRLCEIGEQTKTNIRISRFFSHSWPNVRGMTRSFSGDQDKAHAMIRSFSAVQDEASRDTSTLMTDVKVMIRSYSGDQPQPIQHRIPANRAQEPKVLRRSFSGSQDAKRSDPHTYTIYTDSEDFRIMSIKGSSESIEKATSRALYLLLESNPTRDFLKAAGAALRSFSLSTTSVKRDISDHPISVNFVVPGGTQLQELKNDLFAMMLNGGLDMDGLLLEKSTLECELKGGNAGVFVVRGKGKAVVKMLANAVRLLCTF